MTPDEFRAELSRLGMTQAGAARFLKVDERTIRRWATGDKEVPEAVALLLPRLSPDDIQRG